MLDALDIVIADPLSRRVTRIPLTREKKQTWFPEAALLHTWVLDRCSITDGAAVADALEDMRKDTRAAVIAFLAELVRNGDVLEAAEACQKGDCQDFGALLRG